MDSEKEEDFRHQGGYTQEREKKDIRDDWEIGTERGVEERENRKRRGDKRGIRRKGGEGG